MTMLIVALESRLFDRIQPEDRIHALSACGALIFIALLVVGTFPVHQTF